MAMTRGGDTVLVKFFGASSQTPVHSHLMRGVFRRSMYRTCVSFSIVVSLASLHVLGMVSPSLIHHEIRAKGQSAKKAKVVFFLSSERIMIVLRMCLDSVYRQTRYTRDTLTHTIRCDTRNTSKCRNRT